MCGRRHIDLAAAIFEPLGMCAAVVLVFVKISHAVFWLTT